MSNHINQPLRAIDAPIMLFDGGSLDNPGQGAAAAILLMPNGRRYTVSQFLSFTTTQEAEYTGLIIGLKKAKSLGIRSLDIKGDSEIVFNQINGFTPVSDGKLSQLYQEGLKLIRGLNKATLEWIPREQNRSARAAVNRCIGEALGKESQGKTKKTQPVASPEVAQIVKLGVKATPADYQRLRVEGDEFTAKPIAELSLLIAGEIQEAIALELQGNEQDLAEVYRWYLRGLPPKMAIRKIMIDRETDNQNLEELLLDEPLLPLPELQSGAAVSESPLPTPPAFKFPYTGKPENQSSLLSSSLLDPIDIDRTDLFLSPPNFDLDLEIAEKPEELEELIVAPKLNKAPEISKDTLPSGAKVKHLIEIMETLSAEEKMTFVQELVKFPDLVNLMLKAITDKMSGNSSR